MFCFLLLVYGLTGQEESQDYWDKVRVLHTLMLLKAMAFCIEILMFVHLQGLLVVSW